MVNDVISDFITRIRNASIVRHKIVKTPATKITIAIAKILKIEGFIDDFEKFDNSLLIFLKYKNQNKYSTINSLKRISKPGRRVYLKKKNLPKRIGSFGVSILSTSNGIISDKMARLANIGGEVLIYIY